MKCSKCGIELGLAPLFRNNAKGEPADWRCEGCLDKKPDRVVKDIVSTLHEANGGI
jgi:hypothetical protein